MLPVHHSSSSLYSLGSSKGFILIYSIFLLSSLACLPFSEKKMLWKDLHFEKPLFKVERKKNTLDLNRKVMF